MKYFTRLLTLLLVIGLLPAFAFAQNFDNDLSITDETVRVEDDILIGRTVRIYATVNSHSGQDLFGVVKFYDENREEFVGTDQPVSVLAGKTDDVFIDWDGGSYGQHNIAVRLVPWQEEGDNPDNNKVTKSIFVDRDSDGDSVGDRQDIDDDNDGVNDGQDAFPYDPDEWEDTDGDGIGNNIDEDDDGDGVSDIADFFPLDPNESADSDGDGIGDNADAFPNDVAESADTDNDGLGDNSDPNDENRGPDVIIETEKATVTVDTPVTFNGLRSSDPDGNITGYEWRFSDGGTGEGVVVDHTFKKTGNYNVILRATDDDNEYREQIIQVNVRHKWQTVALLAATVFLALLILLPLLFSKKGNEEFEENPIPKKKQKTAKKRLPKKKK